MEKVGIRVFLVFVFLSLAFIFLDSRGNLVFLKNGSSFVLSPVLIGSARIHETIGDSFSFLTFWKTGEQRIRNLEERNLELLVKAGKAEALERENKELRRQLGVKNLTSFKMLPARVLGSGRFLLIGAGTKDGVSVGQTVVYQNGLVGKIKDTSTNWAHVQLPTDPNSKIPVLVGPLQAVRGLVVGQFNSSMNLDQVMQTEKINSNDVVYTSGEDAGIIPGLIVGKIGQKISKEADLFKKAEVKPIFNYDELTTVFVILG